ncbi:hypothetical protein Rwratislav_31629 [Rhodococcus wratislaviensis IFP 2016]|nr:hypothetical protein Rwratislav_31629 [Rhodococcus wratislaviensis IFP 2016]
MDRNQQLRQLKVEYVVAATMEQLTVDERAQLPRRGVIDLLEYDTDFHQITYGGHRLALIERAWYEDDTCLDLPDGHGRLELADDIPDTIPAEWTEGGQQ